MKLSMHVSNNSPFN